MNKQCHRSDGGAEKEPWSIASGKAAQPKRKKGVDVRQTGLKLPIKGSKQETVDKTVAQSATTASRKRA